MASEKEPIETLEGQSRWHLPALERWKIYLLDVVSFAVVPGNEWKFRLNSFQNLCGLFQKRKGFYTNLRESKSRCIHHPLINLMQLSISSSSFPTCFASNMNLPPWKFNIDTQSSHIWSRVDSCSKSSFFGISVNCLRVFGGCTRVSPFFVSQEDIFFLTPTQPSPQEPTARRSAWKPKSPSCLTLSWQLLGRGGPSIHRSRETPGNQRFFWERFAFWLLGFLWNFGISCYVWDSFCCRRIAGVGSLKWKGVMVMFFGGAQYHLKIDEIRKWFKFLFSVEMHHINELREHRELRLHFGLEESYPAIQNQCHWEVSSFQTTSWETLGFWGRQFIWKH